MKSVPETLIGKPLREWTPRDVWMVRFLFSAGGGCLWILLATLVNFLQQQTLFPWLILLWTGLIYGSVLMVLMCKALPMPASARASRSSAGKKKTEAAQPQALPAQESPALKDRVTGSFRKILKILRIRK